MDMHDVRKKNYAAAKGSSTESTGRSYVKKRSSGGTVKAGTRHQSTELDPHDPGVFFDQNIREVEKAVQDTFGFLGKLFERVVGNSPAGLVQDAVDSVSSVGSNFGNIVGDVVGGSSSALSGIVDSIGSVVDSVVGNSPAGVISGVIDSVTGGDSSATPVDSSSESSAGDISDPLDWQAIQEYFNSLIDRAVENQQTYNTQSAQQAMDFSADQAQIQRDWYERLSNTSYQRAVADLRAAGLNPILAVGGMQGASSAMPSSPSGVSASSSQGNYSLQGLQIVFGLLSSIIASTTSLGTSALKLLPALL